MNSYFTPCLQHSTLPTMFLKQPLNLESVASFVLFLLWLFLVSWLDSSMFPKDSSLATFLLHTLCQRLSLYLTYVWMVPKSMYSDVTWTSDPNFQQPPGNVCKDFFWCLKLNMCQSVTHCSLLLTLLSLPLGSPSQLMATPWTRSPRLETSESSLSHVSPDLSSFQQYILYQECPTRGPWATCSSGWLRMRPHTKP